MLVNGQRVALDQEAGQFIHEMEGKTQLKNKILRGLGKMYSGGGDLTQNIDSYGGEGTAEFVDRAIQVYCDRR